MAVKKKAKKKVSVEPKKYTIQDLKPGGSLATEDHRGENMNAATIERMQKLVAEIGDRKRQGFVYILSSKSEPTVLVGEIAKAAEADGVLFFNDFTARDMLGNFLQATKLNPMSVLGVVQAVQDLQEKINES